MPVGQQLLLYGLIHELDCPLLSPDSHWNSLPFWSLCALLTWAALNVADVLLYVVAGADAPVVLRLLARAGAGPQAAVAGA